MLPFFLSFSSIVERERVILVSVCPAEMAADQQSVECLLRIFRLQCFPKNEMNLRHMDSDRNRGSLSVEGNKTKTTL